MKRVGLLALVAVSVAVGFWWRVPAIQTESTPVGCDEGDSCSISAENDDTEALDQTSRTEDELAQKSTDGEAPALATPDALPKASSPSPGAPVDPAPASADAVALRKAADELLAKGPSIEGLEALRRATEADPSARNHGDLGTLLETMTAFDDALIHLRRAADLDPNNADRWIALANGYYRKVDPGEAWKAERRAREAEPGLVLGRDSNGMRIRVGGPAPDRN